MELNQEAATLICFFLGLFGGYLVGLKKTPRFPPPIKAAQRPKNQNQGQVKLLDGVDYNYFFGVTSEDLHRQWSDSEKALKDTIIELSKKQPVSSRVATAAKMIWLLGEQHAFWELQREIDREQSEKYTKERNENKSDANSS